MNAPPPIERKLPSVVVTTLVTLLLALQWWLGVSATREMSSTYDELAHVTGGLSYWKYNDYRLQPENGNLPQRLAGLPWFLSGARMDTSDTGVWSRSNVWIIGHQLFYEEGNNTDYLLLLSRATVALTGVVLGLLIFGWSRRLWGDMGGLVSLGLYVFCPNFLANAPLATSDVTTTLCLLAACGAFWQQTRRLSWKTGLLSVAIMALTCVAKFSFGVLLPIFALLMAWRFFSEEPLLLAIGPTRSLNTWRSKLGLFALSAFVHVLAAWLVIWACFGFRFSAVGPGMPAQTQFFAPWELVMPARGFWHFFFSVTRGGHLLPEPFLQGFAYVLYASAERGAFLNGEYSITGWPQFFPYAFLVKTPWAQLTAFLLAGALALARWRQAGPWRATWLRLRGDLYRLAPLVTLFAVYWAFSLTSHLNIGLRHLLPTYAVLFIGAGLLARTGTPRWAVAFALLLVGWNAVESARIRPHYLAYFNAFAGGPENGWRHLVDSSLDWGQDLPGLKAWLQHEGRPGEEVYVAYAGNGDFEYEGIRAHELAPINNFAKPRRWFEPGPGLYCIAATMLQNTYSSWRGPWSLQKEAIYLSLRAKVAQAVPGQTDQERDELNRARIDLDLLRFSRLCFYLRQRQPEGVVGYSIFIYRLTPEEIQVAINGSLAELSKMMDEAALQARSGE